MPSWPLRSLRIIEREPLFMDLVKEGRVQNRRVELVHTQTPSPRMIMR